MPKAQRKKRARPSALGIDAASAPALQRKLARSGGDASTAASGGAKEGRSSESSRTETQSAAGKATGASKGDREYAAQRRVDQRDKKHAKLLSTRDALAQDERVQAQGAAFGTLQTSLSDALKQSLDNVTAATKAHPAKKKGKKGMTNKARTKLAIDEVSTFNQVLAHPAVQSDPIKAIQEHLRNTLAQQAQS